MTGKQVHVEGLFFWRWGGKEGRMQNTFDMIHRVGEPRLLVSRFFLIALSGVRNIKTQ